MLSRLLAGFLLLALAPQARTDDPNVIAKIAFGSCINQDKPAPILDAMAGTKPDLLLLIGDNMYADLDKSVKVTPGVIREKYQAVAKVPGFVKLKGASGKVLGTWDDHDYGRNDAGVEWEHKDAAQKEFHDFFGTPQDDQRRKQKGVYHAEVFGPPGKRVQVILLDTRYFRSQLKKGKFDPATRVTPYLPSTDEGATFLGAEQWKWLEEQLKKPAEVRVLVSSIQVVSDEHVFEKWTNIPAEREKLYSLIRSTGANGVVILSGDRHLAEISLDPKSVGYPLYELTSSGLNQASKNWREPEKNSKRVAGMPYGDNFGLITIDWNGDNPRLTMQIRDEDGDTACGVKVRLSTLKGAGGSAPANLPAGVLSPLEAAKRAGETVTVQFVVQSVGGTKTLYLNSRQDFKAKDNFTLALPEKVQTEMWTKANTEKLVGKAVRATGKVEVNMYGLAQIVIADEKSLAVVEK